MDDALETCVRDIHSSPIVVEGTRMSRATVRTSSTSRSRSISSSISIAVAVSRRGVETIGNRRRAWGRVVARGRKEEDDGAFDAMRGREMLERAMRRAMGTGGERRADDGTTRFEANARAASWDALAREARETEDAVDPDVGDARANARDFGVVGGARVTFYRDSASWCPYSQKIWMQLEEKRIPYALKRINMRCYGPKPASFTSMVPSGALPVIELDGQVITESSVISRVLESEFTDDDGHKNLLPYAPGSDDGRRADALMRLERALFSRWMQWITSSWNDASAQSVYCEVLDEVDAELGAGGGPYFMGEEFTLVDIAYAPFLERMAASILYYKGVKIEGNGGRWPNVDAWFAAMASRKVYRGIKSDYYTTAHDLPPQLGGCAENGENAEARDAIDGTDGVHWRLPLGPLDETSLEPWWGVDDPKAARMEAARRVIENRVNVVRFAARGCGQEGRPGYSAPLSDPNARPGEEHIPAVDEALRIVVDAMMRTEDDVPSSDAVTRGDVFAAAPAVKSLAYLRDRVGVPRDMSYPAARQFRAYLNWAIDALATV